MYCGFAIRYAFDMAKTRGMKVTTVRFSQDLWDAVAAEAEIAGVSASQFIREAALARAAAAAGSRGELLFEGFASAVRDAARIESLPPERQREIETAVASVTRALAAGTRSDSRALHAQSQQAKRMSADLRERSRSNRPT